MQPTKCHFDAGEMCTALNQKNCPGCKFRKTTAQYYDAEQQAAAARERRFARRNGTPAAKDLGKAIARIHAPRETLCRREYPALSY